MGRCIAKLGEDQYLEWSTIVDRPVSYILTRKQMIDQLIERGIKDLKKETDERMARADEHETSWESQWETIEEMIMTNRAGPKEEKLTLDQIKKEYVLPKEEVNNGSNV